MAETLAGKVAIVTGAGRGIGRSAAALLAKEGAAIVVNDLGVAPDGTGADNSPAAEVAREIQAAGGAAVADGGDVADVATGRRLVDLALSEYGRLDILVNAAGILRDRMIFNMAPEDWDAVIRVHLRGHFSTARPASAYWREQRNPHAHYRIINFSSLSGLQGSPGQPNYAAAKMGVIGLTYSLAQGLARYGVTANAVAPGAATRLSETVPDAKRAVSRTVGDPSRSPDNVAPVVAYLASDRSAWLTGRTLFARGYQVSLYSNPEVVSTVLSDGPWALEDLSQTIEAQFRPLADGLPPSLFAAQVQRAGTRN
jgi:NAD(P)-dependent dehydrogenase (short-subunit alcohol dehydrogenase family)